jgi:Lrp/AsnC family leucine-responsive transcriptional regulator
VPREILDAIDHAILTQLAQDGRRSRELRFVDSTQVDDIDKTYAGLPELVEAFTVAGDPDALVRLRVRDLAHLKDVINVIRRSGRVTGTKSLIVLGTTAGA